MALSIQEGAVYTPAMQKLCNVSCETIINQVVQCRGFNKLITIETCQQSCADFGGIHKEPVKGRNEKGEMVLIKYDFYIKCNRPRLLPFTEIGELLPQSTREGK